MTIPRKKINKIQFGLFSPQELRASSVANIMYPETMFQQVPKEGGLIDLRLGTTERQFLCGTCNQSSLTCVGHFGHIDLVKPVFHVGYMNKIKKVLETVCFYCSRLKGYDVSKSVDTSNSNVETLVSEEKKENLKNKKKIKSLNFWWSLCKGKTACIHCQSKQPLIKRDGLSLTAFIKGEESTEGKVILNGEKVSSIFKRISTEENELLGFDEKFSRPEWMIISVLNVTPMSVRPSVVLEGTLRGEDDLTHKLSDIVKCNKNLEKYEKEGAPGHIIRDYENLLQYHVATLMDNSIPGLPQSLQKSGRPLKSISARLKGKEGRIRGNLMGKRVDFSARSVISPDSNLSLDEVGVPIQIAKIHTFPEKVTSFNIQKLQKLIDNGPNKYPGANFVTREDGQKIDLRYNKNNLALTIGCIVERHMTSEDIVLFNRQPSLHKMSMMAHKPRIMPGRTFRLNLSVTTPYNADFDGDEMNLHMPQSYNTRAELEYLVKVKHNVVSSQGNKPVMGIVQDSLVGVKIMTGDSIFFDVFNLNKLFYQIDFPDSNTLLIKLAYKERPAILRPKKLFTGKQVFSFLLPEINYNRGDVRIKKGILLHGSIDKKIVGTSQGSLIHVLCLENYEILHFFNSLQLIVHAFLLQHGFSMGIEDAVTDTYTIEKITESIQKAKLDSFYLIEECRKGKMKKLPGMNFRETFESKITQILNKARDTSGRYTSDSFAPEYRRGKPFNNILMMVEAGSKGSLINISQIIACVGQQNVEGHRIGFSAQRTLPHFHKDDNRPESRGFVENSYLSGLRPDEFYFHAMGGREGLIDTAVKTAETGYIQRRLIKAMENCKIAFDGSVRSEQEIISFNYGDDGFDGSKIERVRVCGSTFYLPFNFDRLINDHNKKNIPQDVISTDSAKTKMINELKQFTNNLVIKAYVTENTPRLQRMSLNELTELIVKVKNRYKSALCPMNEMVGTLASQSIGEPATQMTLNTFHFAGISSTVTMGVPRLKEIINLAQNIKTPSMTLTLKKDLAKIRQEIHCGLIETVHDTVMGHKVNEQLFANEIKNMIEYKEMKDVLEKISIWYDPVETDTVVEEDKDIVEAHYMFMDDPPAESLSAWILRLEVNRSKMLQMNIKLSVIKRKIEELVTCQVIMSDDNAENYVVRIRLDGSADDTKMKRLMDSVIGLQIGGMRNIKRVYLVERVKSSEIRIDPELIRTMYDNTDELKKRNEEIRRKEEESIMSWQLQTNGTNLRDLMNNPFIADTYSNDIYEIHEILGLEAARTVILNEIKKVLESDGSYVNARHLMLLGDIMTYTGNLLGITRHGINKNVGSPLMRCTFEETVEILLNASAKGEISAMNSVSEGVMSGNVVFCGTGSTDLILDMQAVKNTNLSFLEAKQNTLWSPETLFSPSVSPGNESSAVYTPSVEVYTPSGQMYSPMSPKYSPVSPKYSPMSPKYSPMSPKYSPMSPKYSPISPKYSPISPKYSPISPKYSPLSPKYTKKQDKENE